MQVVFQVLHNILSRSIARKQSNYHCCAQVSGYFVGRAWVVCWLSSCGHRSCSRACGRGWVLACLLQDREAALELILFGDYRVQGALHARLVSLDLLRRPLRIPGILAQHIQLLIRLADGAEHRLMLLLGLGVAASNKRGQMRKVLVKASRRWRWCSI